MAFPLQAAVIQIYLDEYETQTEFKDQNDTLSEFGNRDDTLAQVRWPTMNFTHKETYKSGRNI